MITTEQRRPDGSHRVVVTGMGAVTGFGLGIGPFWDGIETARCAIEPTSRTFDTMEVIRPAATIVGYQPGDHFSVGALLMCDPFAQYSLLAAREAIAGAGLVSADLADAAIILGCGGGGEISREETAIQLFANKRPRAHPATVPRCNHQAAVGSIAIEHQILGPAFVVATGCASASHAIAQAAMMVRHGYVERALVGGTEANVIYAVMRSFDSARTIASDTCRPFSRGRSGLALGEGAGVMVIETLASADRRDAPVLAEIAGFGMSSDAADAVQPTLRGPVRAVTQALADANLVPDAIGYVNAHGTGTQLNDIVETAAVHEIFGAHACNLVMSSTKSQIGHTFGAAGALELIATILGMTRGVAPPTVNYLGADPDCDIDCVPNEARDLRFNAAVSQSFAFGGVNAAVVARRL
jgi:nodulation protein E